MPDSPLQLQPLEQRAVVSMLDSNLYLIREIRLYVLLRLDAALSKGEAHYKLPVVTVEHVLPQNPPPHSIWMQWFPTQADRDRWVQRLANLVLLSHKKNSQAQNYDFVLKKQKYFTTDAGVSPFALTTQVLKEHEWTPQVLEQRQENAIDILKATWRLQY